MYLLDEARTHFFAVGHKIQCAKIRSFSKIVVTLARKINKKNEKSDK